MRICRLVWGGLLPLSLLLAGSLGVRADEVSFNRDIRPIFVQHCLACHGGVKQAAELSFVYPASVLPPDGWVIEPGDPAASELMSRVVADDPDVRMPPPEHGPPLDEREIELLRDWIAQGAAWQSHWAFQRPSKLPLPTVSDPEWPTSELDYFVMARLDQEKLSPADDATPYRWLRRASLDLVGLPPTSEQLSQFQENLEALGKQAYEQEIDRLLASEHFGERWASVWLDQVRYADSMGLGIDARRTIWKYRDWVIRALNDDLPYDQFTRQQIAGDLLPNASPDDLIATACHRLTQTNGEGGTDDEEFRVAAVLDRVNTTWQAWQGLTFGCVQCHSHPYEPFEHEDYYRFVALFNNTVDCDLESDAPTYQTPVNPQDYSRAAELDKKIERVERSTWQPEFDVLARESLWQPLRGLQAETNKATQVAVETKDTHDEFHTVGTIERNTDITLDADLPAGMRQLTAIRVTALPLDPAKAVADSEWGFVWSHVEAALVVPGEASPLPISFARVYHDEPTPLQDPQASLDPKSNQGFSAYTRIHYPRRAALVLSEPMEVPAGARLRVTLKHRVYLLGAFSLVTRRGHVAVSSDPQFPTLLESQPMQKKRKRLAKLKSERKEIESISTPVLRERPAHLARPTHVFTRGLFLTKAEQVDAGVPASLTPRDLSPVSNRLALADWLVSPANPLTARVAVNRFWARLFGVGIVETEEDFGSSGERPSHPALLDHLATKFQGELNWSVKQLLREIVLSRTYRQSSVTTAEMLEVDPDNRLLTRGASQRLSAEIIRDQALAVSGLLNDEMFGPPVQPPLPAGVWQPFAANDKWPAPEPGDPQRYRRSIYTYVKRSIPYPMHATFDQPSREFCVPRRLRSNTPLQALELLNSEAFAECAAALAGRMRQHSDALDEQLTHGFLLTVLRPPAPTELDVLRELHDRLPAERGLVAVATALLNLDEFVTK